VKEVIPFTSPAGRSYRILKTTEVDAYELPKAAKEKKRRSERRK
jgi:hypothetical protein